MKKTVLALLFSINVYCLNAQTLPTPDHVIIIMMENRGYSNIIGSSNAPYINSLVSGSNCAVFSQSYGVTHPSQPNYISLFSGNNQGVTNDNTPTGTPYSTCNLGSSLLTHSLTFTGFSEDLPSVGSLISTSGNYVQRHCPWTFWQGTGTNRLPSTVHQPYTSFPSATSYSLLPTVSFIIPNLAHDMHNPTTSPTTAITTGDTWLSNNIPSLVQWVKTHNSLLIIQYDEDEGIVIGGVTIGGAGNNIPTMFIGSMVHGGTYSNHINHFNILRTIEDMYALPRCDSSALYQPITNCWLPAVTTGITNSIIKQFQLYPIPTSNQLNIELQEEITENAHVSVTDMYGRLLYMEELTTKDKNLTIDTKNFKSGVYFLSVHGNSIHSSQRFVIERD